MVCFVQALMNTTGYVNKGLTATEKQRTQRLDEWKSNVDGAEDTDPIVTEEEEKV